jgi:hypothetical protein
MVSLITDIFSSLRNWQKALLFSFVSYMIVLLGIFVAVVFIMKGFSKNLPILAGITIAYMLLMLSVMLIARSLFKKGLAEE